MPLTGGNIEGELKIVYHEVSLDDVMKYFVNGFDRDVWDYTWFCDSTKGQVVFKLYIDETEEEG